MTDNLCCDPSVDCDEPPIIGDPWSASIPPNLDYILRIEEGVVRVYKGKDDLQDGRHAPYPVTTFNHFIDDMKFLCRTITDGPLKSFCFKRLAYLSHKFQLHVLLNDLQELKAQKQVPHRDFYNVRKVDTHVHAASCMNQKHLLRFIKKTIKTRKDDKVCLDGTGKALTLEQVFNLLQLTSYDLSVDMLDVHADRNTFHRFDKFNT
ncbi:unnamed protein product, partial [Oppiella nova]